MKKGPKMTKDTVPEGFSLALGLVDLVPVVFFGLSALRVGQLFSSTLFMVGAAVCLGSGLVKALWKLIAARSGKNVWPMFVQMRILMPAGFLIMLAALLAGREKLQGGAILSGLLGFPAWVFFGLGALGMVLMTVFALRLDPRDPKANWLEQAVNGAGQLCFFMLV